MPYRIIFDDPKMRVHVCTDNLKEFVIEDIRVRYGMSPVRVVQVEHIHMDPGGMAFQEPTLIKFSLQGTKFQCNAEHLEGVLYGLNNKYRLIDTNMGKLARIYMYWDILVLPASCLWAINNRLERNITLGEEAAEKVRNILFEANQRASELVLPENIVPLFNED